MGICVNAKRDLYRDLERIEERGKRNKTGFFSFILGRGKEEDAVDAE